MPLEMPNKCNGWTYLFPNYVAGSHDEQLWDIENMAVRNVAFWESSE